MLCFPVTIYRDLTTVAVRTNCRATTCRGRGKANKHMIFWGCIIVAVNITLKYMVVTPTKLDRFFYAFPADQVNTRQDKTHTDKVK